MFAIIQNNQIVQIVRNSAFTFNDIQYPQNWWQLASDNEKAEIGAVAITFDVRPDDRYYWVTEHDPVYANGVVTVSYTTTPKDLTALKVLATEQVNLTAGAILAPTDYMVIKAYETGKTIDAAWNTWRNEIRTQVVAQKTAISACTTVEQLIALAPVVWAHDPNYVAPTETT